MSRGRKIAAMLAGGLAGLLLLALIAGVLIVRTQWFRDTVRDKIVAAVEESTGGRTEIGAFAFDWTHLRAVVRRFVIHGSEPAGAAPLFQASLLEVDLKLTSPFKNIVDIAYLLVDTPQANVIVNADGTTNIPAPKIKHTSNKTGLETIVELAIGRFDLRNGSLSFANRKTPLEAHGQNLRAELGYNPLAPSYQGQVTIQPLLVASGTSQPVAINIAAPVVLEKDRIRLNNAQVSTAGSQINVSASMDHLVAPRTTARVNAHIALEEAQRIAGAALPIRTGKDLPRVLEADASVYMDENNKVRISSARMALGQSSLEASGEMQEGIKFIARLATAELERLFRLAASPLGLVTASGNARINPPESISVSGLRLDALGGEFAGDLTLQNMAQFRLNGKLSHFDIQAAARPLMTRPPPYDGVISGPVQAKGNTKIPRTLAARADLSIAPGRRGIPVSGRINADYDGNADTVTLARSYLALPNTRADLSGALGRQIDVRLVSRNLKDIEPALSAPLPVTLNRGGSATFTGSVTGKLSAPQIAGHVAVANFAAEGRPFNLLAADVSASPAEAAVKNGTLSRGQLQARFAASVGLRNWKPEDRGPLTANLAIQNADVQDLLALAGQQEPVTGTLAASAQIAGTLGNPRGNAAIDIANGSAYQEHFDRLTMRANLSNQLIDVTTLQVAAGSARIDANASYQHAADSLQRGNLRVHLASNQFQLAQFHNVTEQAQGLDGQAQIQADATATVGPVAGQTEVNLTSLNANIAARGLERQGKKLGDLTATAQTSGNTVNYRVNSDFAGSTIRVNGQSLLTGDHPTTATASINGLPIEQVLAAAGRRDIPAAGVLSANASVSGTLANPQGKADFTITKGHVDQQPFDRMQANVTYTSQLIDVSSFQVAIGSNRVDFNGSFAHPAGDFEAGSVRFHLASNRIELAQLQEAQQLKPGLAGALQLAADGAATLRRGATPLVSTLNANVAATGLALNGKPAGSLTATATTRASQLEFNLNSDFAQANIRGSGSMRLADDYPLSARLDFAHVTYAGLAPWLNSTGRPSFDALAEGQVQVKGAAANPDDLKGAFQLSRLEVNPATLPNQPKPRRSASLRNAGPIELTLDRSVVRIQSFRLAGTDMNLSLTGTAALRGTQALDLRADGNVNLAVIEAFDPDVFSSGGVALSAAAQGTLAQPAVNGRLQLQKASLNLISAPNGLSNANGVIVFTGDHATLQNVTGESGGGKITLAGDVAYGGPTLRVNVQATAHHVRVSTPEGVSTEVNANLALAGTTARNVLSGDVTILDVALHSHSDIGSMLSQAATPPPVSQPQTGLLGGTQLDVRIQTSPNARFRTTLAQNIRADANLNLRGSPSQPGMLGRLEVAQGEIVFFGSKYTIDQGTVSFYDPHKINPFLNAALETTVKGITVTLNVNGPMDRLKLTYTSDPPMQFSDIVALLGSGKVPTTDPVLAARQPPPPQQSVAQQGASAVLNQAVASPVAGRLQRLFGVTRLSIDPQILGSNTPQAKMTLQQQISKNVLFSYMQDVSSSNPQLLRVEWDVNPAWTAVAQRAENGEVAVDLFYKKRFH
jgi:translocation and assembly module TamB